SSAKSSEAVMWSVRSSTWMSKLFVLRRSSFKAASTSSHHPGSSDDSRSGRRGEPEPSAERFEDTAAAQHLVAGIHHDALPRSHRALLAAELHADPLAVERLDHRRHVV